MFANNENNCLIKITSTFKDKKYEKSLKVELNSSKSEIFSSLYENRKVWVKKGRATLSTKLHHFFYKISPFEILLPVENKNAKETILFETNKLTRFKGKGIDTPSIIGRNKEFFVLEDCGKNLNSFIRKRDIKKDKMYYYIDKLIVKLACIHNHNEFHGGAQARNFTYKDGKIFVIDLEDSFDKSVDIKLLQFRDLCLLLLSLTKTRANYELDFKYIIYKYIELSKNDDFIHRLNNIGNKVFIFLKFSEINFIQNLLGRDVKNFFKFVKILKGLKENEY